MSETAQPSAVAREAASNYLTNWGIGTDARCAELAQAFDAHAAAAVKADRERIVKLIGECAEEWGSGGIFDTCSGTCRGIIDRINQPTTEPQS